MATSGSTDYTLNAKKIIYGAFRLMGVKEQGQAPNGVELSEALESLELMVKSSAYAEHLWSHDDATLFLEEGKQSYTIPGDRAVTTFRETTTTAAAVATDLTIDVTSISGISAGDVIGIQTSSTNIDWTTVNGAPAVLTVTILAGLTEAVTAGATVYVYTASSDLMDKPLKIFNLQRRLKTIDTPIDILSEDEYYELPSKGSKGLITQIYPEMQRATCIFHVWTTSSTVSDILKFRYQRTLEDLDLSTNDFDFPQEWLEVLKYNLAVRLAPEYGVQLDKLVLVMAAGLLEEMTMFDTENASTFFAPETRYSN